jgi:tetratricopeptide (TPR) repeat protein
VSTQSSPEGEPQSNKHLSPTREAHAGFPGFRVSTETWIALGILILTLAAYLQVIGFDFVTFDDPLYLTNNPTIQAGLNWKSLRYAFTTRVDGSFLPLNWLSHAACASMFGAWAGGHHLVNLLLHGANSVLLFYLLNKMTKSKWPSAIVAFLFALHPLHVESVAWVSERKDVLSTLFWILTTWAYVRYVERPSAGRYLGAALLFLAGLLSKSMLVTLPLTLFLFDLWPLGRIEWTSPATARAKALWMLFREKIPLFVLALLVAFITVRINHGEGNIATLENLSISSRTGNAAVSIVTYLHQAFWPVDLSIFYPISSAAPAMGRVVRSLAILLTISGICILNLRRRPYLVVGWLWYLITLLPVIGIVQVGLQAHADRYTYVPLIGIFLMLSWLGADLVARWRIPGRLVLMFSASILGLLFTLTTAQVVVWRDNLMLFKNALSVDAENAFALLNIGDEYGHRGRWKDAQAAYTQALRFMPGVYMCDLKLGFALEQLGQEADALKHYLHAKSLQPNLLIVDQRIGQLLTRMGRFQEAEPFIKRVVQRTDAQATPLDAINLYGSEIDWATILNSQKRFSEAIAVLEGVLAQQPKSAKAQGTLGLTFRLMGRLEESLRQMRLTAELSPENPEVLYQLGVSFALLHRFDEARGVFARLKPLDPGLAEKGLLELQGAQAQGQ